MNNNPRKLLIRIIALVLGVLILSFIYFRLRPYLSGPYIENINLNNYLEIETYSLTIEARFEHTSAVSINGSPVILNERGEIQHTLALTPGHNIIELELSDDFGNSKNYTYTVISPASEKIYPPLYNEEESLEEPSEELSADQEPIENSNE